MLHKSIHQNCVCSGDQGSWVHGPSTPQTWASAEPPAVFRWTAEGATLDILWCGRMKGILQLLCGGNYLFRICVRPTLYYSCNNKKNDLKKHQESLCVLLF